MTTLPAHSPRIKLETFFPHCQTPHKLRSHPRSLPAAVKHHWLPLRSLTFEMYFAGTVPLIPGDKITSLALWKKGTPSWGTDFGWNLVSWSKLCLTGDIQNSKWSSHLIQAKLRSSKATRQEMCPGWITSPRCFLHCCLIRGVHTPVQQTHPNGRGQIDVDGHLSQTKSLVDPLMGSPTEWGLTITSGRTPQGFSDVPFGLKRVWNESSWYSTIM